MNRKLSTHSTFGLLAVLLTLAPAAASAATPENYTAAITSAAYPDLDPAQGAIQTLNANNDVMGVAGVDLPFPIRFFGERYTQMAVSTGGYITFGPYADAECVDSRVNCGQQPQGQRLPNAAFPNQLLAVWWGNHTCPMGSLRTQVQGEAPNRTFVVEWKQCDRSPATHVPYGEFWTAQARFFEGSSTVEVYYDEGDTYNKEHADFPAAIGIEDPSGTVGASPLACSPNCLGKDWPTQSKITYTQGAHLRVVGVRTAHRAFSGLPYHVEADVRNEGGSAASSVSVAFSLRPATGGGADVSLGLSDARSLQPGEVGTFTLDPEFPDVAEETPWNLVVHADPHEVVPQHDRSENIRLHGPIELGGALPDVAIDRLSTPPNGQPGGQAVVEWRLRNLGNGKARDVAVTAYLGKDEQPHLGSRPWFTERIDLEAFEEREYRIEATVPTDLPPGEYFIAVFVDPEGEQDEIDKSNNVAYSSVLRVRTTTLEVLTQTLPDAVVGTPWALRLDASGGDGSYRWSIPRGSELPPGISLVQEGEATLLAGTPTAEGSYAFSVTVASSGIAASQELELTVHRATIPLTITTVELPIVPLGFPYQASLSAVGGAPPYRWSLIEGRLHRGLTLLSDGSISGIVEEDGSQPLTVQVQDADGATATASLELQTFTPSRLSCLTRTLPTVAVGEEMMSTLAAAGGQKPYEWSSVRSFRLADGRDDPGESYGSGAPAGLTLSDSGFVAGRPNELGRFLWVVQVADERGSRDTCAVVFETRAAGSIVIETVRLGDAVAGETYQVTLRARGGAGLLHWSLIGGSLPPGLRLDPNGTIEGVATLTGLDRQDHVFLVEVRDATQQRATAALHLGVVQPSGATGGGGGSDDSGGCQSAGSGAPFGLASILVATGWLLRSRRRQLA